ncbi:MAG: flavin reductase family protein [Betaproteobacteria bacterium]|nr:flavin reductase family protein [Betaproteobacteria bacterium]
MELALAALTPSERYKLLTGFVIPRPIAWISTTSAGGVSNCAPFSFFNVVADDPPLLIVGFGPGSAGEPKHSLKNIRRTGEFVVNLVEEANANAMHRSSDEIPEDESEFALAGLTAAPSVRVSHPRIAEASVSFECKVYRRIEVHPLRELILGEILLVHARDGLIDVRSKRVNEALYRPIGRLYANRYCTTRQRFNLPGDLPGEAT